MAESIKDECELEQYILMERIRPIEHLNYLVCQNKISERLRVVSEIGIFGITIRFALKFLIGFRFKNAAYLIFFINIEAMKTIIWY